MKFSTWSSYLRTANILEVNTTPLGRDECMNLINYESCGLIWVKIHWFDNLPIKLTGGRNHASLFPETKNFRVENMSCEVCVCLRSSKCHYSTLSHHVLTWTHGTMRRDFKNEDKSSFQHWLSRLYLLPSFKAWSDLILLLCTERFSFSFSFQMELENNCSFQTLTFSALFQFSSVKIYLLFVLASFFPPFLCHFHFPSC